MSSDATAASANVSASPTANHGRFSLQAAARRWSLPVVGLWLVMCAVTALMWSGRSLEVTGALDGLIPPEHRHGQGRALALLQAEDPKSTTTEDLLAASFRIHDGLGERWEPLGAPSSEVAGWLDTYALFLLPTSAHPELAHRLSDVAIEDAVGSLRARLSSPFFGLAAEDPRHDPLLLRQLTHDSAGHNNTTQRGIAINAEVTPSGDLLARDGSMLLLQIHDDASLAAIESELTTLAGPGFLAEVVGPRRTTHAAKHHATQELPRLLTIALAGIMLVLGLAVRQVRRGLATIVVMLSGLAMVSLWLPLNPLSIPLVVLLVGFACEGCTHIGRLSPRGWPAAAVLGTILLPLWLSPYPLWQQWSLHWLGAMAVLVLLLRVVLPALLTQLRTGTGPLAQRPGRSPPRSVVVAVLIATAAMGAGAWSLERLQTQGLDHFELGDAELASRRETLLNTFFDPTLVATAATRAADETGVLAAATVDARVLAELVTKEARAVDSPGSLVLPERELALRRAGLMKLDLAGRLKHLGDTLEAQGFKAAAFGQFLRSAADPDQLPTPQAALEGPLARWVRRYLTYDDQGVTLHSEVHLNPAMALIPPILEAPDGHRLELFGPTIAARADLPTLLERLALYALSGLWLGALVVWLGTRSLATAVSTGLSALATQAAVLALMVSLHIEISPALIPAVLLVGGSAMLCASRTCHAIETQRPVFAVDMWVSPACQLAAALALVTANVPSWEQAGYMLALGCAIGSCMAIFVAPGLAKALRMMLRQPLALTVPIVASPTTPSEDS